MTLTEDRCRRFVVVSRSSSCCCCGVDVENSFKENLINLMPVLVGRGQLVVKEVNGAKLTGKDLAQYFQVGIPHRLMFYCRSI